MKFSIGILAIVALMGTSSCQLMGTQKTKAPTKTTTKAPTNNTNSLTAVPGEWTIYSVDGRNITGDERPYITFDDKNHRFYGSNGCNTINGDYTIDGNKLTLSNVISTMRACPDAPFETAINLALDKVSTFAITRTGNESYMSLINRTGRTVLVLRKHNLDYLNGSWRVAEIQGKSVNPDLHPELQLVIDIPELRIHGNTGCNIVNGNLLIDPDKTDAMQFTDMATTRMACPDGALETEFLLAMEAVDRARPDGSNKVILMDERGKRVIVLQRIDLR